MSKTSLLQQFRNLQTKSSIYFKKHPWHSVGAAFVAFGLIGLAMVAYINSSNTTDDSQHFPGLTKEDKQIQQQNLARIKAYANGETNDNLKPIE